MSLPISTSVPARQAALAPRQAMRVAPRMAFRDNKPIGETRSEELLRAPKDVAFLPIKESQVSTKLEHFRTTRKSPLPVFF